MQTGWIDIPDEIYHNSPQYTYVMTSSGLKQMARSAAHWHEMRTSPPTDPTPALHFGSAFHGYMLDSQTIETIDSKVDLMIENEIIKKADAALTFPKLLETEKLLGPKSETLLVSTDDYNHLSGMKQVLLGNEIAEKLVNHPGAIYERSGFFVDPDYELIGSIKPDIRIPELGIIVDLKTTIDASQWAFPRSVRRYKCDWQAWWYLRGANALSHTYYDTFIIIAIEKVPPYGINIFQIINGLYYADMQVRPLLEDFEISLAADMWPRYPADEVIEL